MVTHVITGDHTRNLFVDCKWEKVGKRAKERAAPAKIEGRRRIIGACVQGKRVTLLTEYPGQANFSSISLQNLFKCLHARQGNPPSRGTLCACAVLYPVSNCHVNGPAG